MLTHPTPGARNQRVGTCGDCRRERRVFDLDGTRYALCVTCLGEAVATVDELLTTRELYEGSTAAEWLEVHRAHGSPVVGCCWCGIGMVA